MRRALVPLMVVALAAGGCATRSPVRADFVVPSPAAPTPPGAPVVVAPIPGKAPATAFAVGLRTLKLSNGAARPLPTTVYYPATGTTAVGTARTGATPAAGRFPVVVFSHGLTGIPVVYQGLLTRWAAAGFVVVAPAYPHTSFGTPKFDVLDVVNQPTDASVVLSAVLALDTTDGDPLRGRLDTTRIAAAGHSAGGITTVGLFAAKRDVRLSAGIVLAGNGLGMGNVYSGPPANLLFVHGKKDTVVSYASGRAAYDKVPWAKAMLTLPADGHSDPFLRTNAAAFAAVAAATTDFLRWTLYGDRTARGRIAADAGKVGSVEDRL